MTRRRMRGDTSRTDGSTDWTIRSNSGTESVAGSKSLTVAESPFWNRRREQLWYQSADEVFAGPTQEAYYSGDMNGSPVSRGDSCTKGCGTRARQFFPRKMATNRPRRAATAEKSGFFDVPVR